MDETAYYWWYAYGSFDPGEHNLPHMGQVIRHYRGLRKWTIKDFARALQVTDHYVYEIESSSNLPESISRRTVIAKLLKIPPALLGLSIITPINQSIDDEIENDITGLIKHIDTQRMMVYEDILAMSWELYYVGNLQRVTSNVDQWLQVLSCTAQEARGLSKHQVLAMLCRYYQLSCTVARDRMDITQALHDSKRAIDLALQLENAELIASAYYRRIRIYLQQEHYEKAAQDTECALHYIDLVCDPLKTTLYRVAAEAYSPLAKEDRSLQKKCLAYLDSAARMVRKGNLETDGSFVKPDIASVQIERAAIYTQFQHYKDARNALMIAYEHISPDNIRRKKDLLLAEAENYLFEDELEESCESIDEALKLSRATGSRSNEKWMLSLYQQLQERDANHPLVCRLGMGLSEY